MPTRHKLTTVPPPQAQHGECREMTPSVRAPGGGQPYGNRRSVIDLGAFLLHERDRRFTPVPAPRADARVVHLPPGPIEVQARMRSPSGWTGHLILDGLILVHLDAGRAHTGWLIGADDLVVPSDLEELSLTAASRWKALVPTRLAVLDTAFTERAAGHRKLVSALVSAAARTASWLLAKSLVTASPAVEERLLLLFALYGERWGIVRSDGILLKLPLTHELLATLCGVRRPSVTMAIRSLQTSGVLTRTGSDSWLLSHGATPETSARHSCWPQYARALGLTAL